MYLLGVLLVIPRYLLNLNEVLLPISEWLVWYSGLPIFLGLLLGIIDLLALYTRKRSQEPVLSHDLENRDITVVLTAYNDELAIGSAVKDFLSHPQVKRVIVISNNSSDNTLEYAVKAGAIGFNEETQGYGQCVYRCFQEALKYDDTDLIVLSEGDCTFKAFDIDKFLAYAPHADIVNGTRTVEVLRQYQTQLSPFMVFGNLFVGKLLEAKHLGVSTLTDVGTTYKLCHRLSLQQLLPLLNPAVNLSFNAHLIDTACENKITIVECPITFHPRVGESKGGNINNMSAIKVGIEMIWGLTFGWKASR